MPTREDHQADAQGLRERLANPSQRQILVLVTPHDEAGHGKLAQLFADRFRLAGVERLRSADEPPAALLALVARDDLAESGILHSHGPGQHLG
jgi:hypothetical protein